MVDEIDGYKLRYLVSIDCEWLQKKTKDQIQDLTSDSTGFDIT